MALIDDVKQVCARLAPAGWGKLLKKHGLDIAKPKAQLAAELERELPIDRDVPGFEDFAFEGKCGIQPGIPARSLLFHALASPNVVTVDGASLGAFPTLAEIEAVENYVYGVRPPSLQELSALAAGGVMAVAVFAVEYRVAVETVHRKHADVCYARAGVARVGTDRPLYDGPARGFTPFVKGKPHAVRVLPARYRAYLAVQRAGDEPSFGPMRFDFRRKHPDLFDPDARTDADRLFWVPLHKLFNGGECLRGRPDLRVELLAHHVNEKIRRIHMELARRGHQTGFTRPEIDQPPFRFTDGIAGFDADKGSGTGLLVPVPHKRMVEPAEFQGKPLTFIVPPQANDFSPSLTISAAGNGERPAPEYVHVRTAPDEADPDLNNRPDVVDVVNAGDYRAQHYVDFTADGWVEARCPDLNVDVPRFVPAYSMVTAPDFYYTVDQRELMDWWLERAPGALQGFLWRTPPLTLADERVTPNLKLNNLDFDGGNGVGGGTPPPRANFRPEDDTATAIVSAPLRTQRQERPLLQPPDNRHSWLPDAAAGIFAPGWDTSFDRTGNVRHLAAYGLGSPFPEDSKLCAALSTFWPSVAPDAGRSFSDLFPTVSPMTDEEIGAAVDGSGGGQPAATPWDGVPGPRVLTAAGRRVVEYATFTHVDYVRSALDNRFSMTLTGRVDTRQYTARVLAMARAYLAVSVPISSPARKGQWNVLSFRAVAAGDQALAAALAEAKVAAAVLGPGVFRVVMYQPDAVGNQPADHRKRHVGIKAETTLYVGGTTRVLIKIGAGKFRARNVNV